MTEERCRVCGRAVPPCFERDDDNFCAAYEDEIEAAHFERQRRIAERNEH